MPNVFPKFSKTFILDQIVGMIQRGHDVVIFAPQSPVESVQQKEVDEYDLYERTTYFSLPDSILPKIMGAAANTLALVLRSPASGRVLLKTAYQDSIKHAGWITYRARPIMDANLDILHAHFGPVGQQAVMFKKMGACDALVTSFHGWGVRRAEQRGSEIYSELFEQCDRILANTNAIREKILQLGASPDKTHIHRIGIDLKKFVPSDRKRESSPTTILTVARLEEVKGISYAISALKQMLNQFHNTNVKYRIVGDGSLRSTLQEQINEHDLEKTVTLCGAKNQSDVIEEMQAADIFLLPSVDEGFGRVLIEAQATKLPVVVSNVGGVKEAISPQKSALLIPPRDSDTMATALTSLVQDPDRCVEMGNAGQQYVYNNFDINQLNNQLEKTYSELLQSP